MTFRPTPAQLSDVHTDITAPQHGVEMVVDGPRGVVWVNIDGICVLRVCRVPRLYVEVNGDRREIPVPGVDQVGPTDP